MMGSGMFIKKAEFSGPCLEAINIIKLTYKGNKLFSFFKIFRIMTCSHGHQYMDRHRDLMTHLIVLSRKISRYNQSPPQLSVA